MFVVSTCCDWDCHMSRGHMTRGHMSRGHMTRVDTSSIALLL